MKHAVRPMLPGDARLLAAVDREWGEAAARAFLGRPSASALVACAAGGGIDGFIIGQAAGGEAEIIQITVAGAARRRGVGSALLGAFLAAHAGKACFLEVRRDNAAAMALYRAHGFAPAGRRRGYYRGREGAQDAVLMRLDTGNPRD